MKFTGEITVPIRYNNDEYRGEMHITIDEYGNADFHSYSDPKIEFTILTDDLLKFLTVLSEVSRVTGILQRL